ncbi:MAG: c-type cytochrome [Oligoflexia bacterium]|nr:c-type cytochrome [Oligoflexia bacterium]
MSIAGKIGSGLALLAVLGFALGLGGLPAQAADQAKALESFKDRKCTECHGLTSHGIGKPEKKAEAEEEGEKEAPDLAKLSDEVMKKADPAAFITAYLKKKEKLHDKQHKKMFKGNMEELKNLSEFLVEGAKKKAK